MSKFDSLQEFHRLRVLRSLPRYHPVEQYDAGPSVAFCIVIISVSVVIGYIMGRIL